ncbi:hypothetical protein CYLTODRAFT_20606 [Cylindrobasidium torrendii FP15055 ss-10]|uniref:Uncharacterized protein n=1 Tax=Cylindrobasidium torrendii FP15055 ss-10 TaxID=1314674 RepID=A0A0D7BBM8_9AGAR|nr:hypothetical protein CYLTODRAFT_20606 [Cylindrobasidium torrendii FP15055 ss-10]
MPIRHHRVPTSGRVVLTACWLPLNHSGPNLRGEWHWPPRAAGATGEGAHVQYEYTARLGILGGEHAESGRDSDVPFESALSSPLASFGRPFA